MPGQPSTRDAILEAAADLFATRGFEYATLNDIAAAAGLSGGSVYNHFRGKPELFLEVVQATLSALSVKPYLSEDGHGPDRSCCTRSPGASSARAAPGSVP